MAATLKKIDYHSPSSHQLLITPQVGEGLHDHFPLLCWDFVWLGLHRSLEFCHNHNYEFICATAVLCQEIFKNVPTNQSKRTYSLSDNCKSFLVIHFSCMLQMYQSLNWTLELVKRK